MKHRKRFRRTGAIAVVLNAFLAILSGCSTDRKPQNVILITLDTFRADHLSALPGGRASTPALDGLASRGILFENAWSTIPITLPAHKSIFFGQPPHILMTYNNGQVVASRRDHPSFVQAFRKKGFATAAFISLGVLGREFGVSEGFDHYDDAFLAERWYLTAEEVNRKVIPWLKSHDQKPFFLWVHYSDPHMPFSPPDMPVDLNLRLNDRLVGSYRLSENALIKADLDLRAGENTLVFETINPYVPDPKQDSARLMADIRFSAESDMKNVTWAFKGGWNHRPKTSVRYFKTGAAISLQAPVARKVTMEFLGELHLPVEAARDLYRREVEFLDSRVGELFSVLNGLGLKDKTAVIVVGDHGEGLGEYFLNSRDRHFGHIHYLEKIYTNVPLIVSVPGDPRNGTRRMEPVSLLDIAPTILELIDFKGIRGLPGRDLRTLPKGATLPLYMETYRPESNGNRFALLEAPWHMIFEPETGRHKMYNLAADPAESENLWGTPSVPADVARIFERRLIDFSREILSLKKDVSVDSKTEKMLKSLGYIGK